MTTEKDRNEQIKYNYLIPEEKETVLNEVFQYFELIQDKDLKDFINSETSTNNKRMNIDGYSVGLHLFDS